MTTNHKHQFICVFLRRTSIVFVDYIHNAKTTMTYNVIDIPKQ